MPIAPGKPQQNGRLERLHRTLKAATASSPADDWRAQKQVFHVWRREYNHERLHEAPKLGRPATVYVTSPRRYPRPWIEIRHDPFTQLVRIDKHGLVKWHEHNVFLSSALSGDYIDIDPDADQDGRCNVRWGAIPLGRLDDHRSDQGLIVRPRPRGSKKVTAMSLL